MNNFTQVRINGFLKCCKCHKLLPNDVTWCSTCEEDTTVIVGTDMTCHMVDKAPKSMVARLELLKSYDKLYKLKEAKGWRPNSKGKFP